MAWIAFYIGKISNLAEIHLPEIWGPSEKEKGVEERLTFQIRIGIISIPFRQDVTRKWHDYFHVNSVLITTLLFDLECGLV